MNILIVSTLKRRVAPDVFASRSRIVFQLAEGLVKRGHHVSLLGTGDSYIPRVTTISVIPHSWVDLPIVENSFLRETATLIQQAKKMIEIQGEFEIIHNHTYPDFFPSVLENELQIPLVTTLHAVYDYYIEELLGIYKKSHFVALSTSYQKKFKTNAPRFVVYNGIDTSLYTFKPEKDNYLLWIGRLSKSKDSSGGFIDPKGVRHAIALAKATNESLKLAGPVEDKKFYEQEVAPHLSSTIQWVGSVSPEQSLPTARVVELMQNAKAFLMTVNQEEPFGLVMAEAGSCGTPVVAFDRGAVREVVVDGKTGFVIDPKDGVNGLQSAVQKLSTIDPHACRKHIEEHFSIDSMVNNYEKLYKKVLDKLEL